MYELRAFIKIRILGTVILRTHKLLFTDVPRTYFTSFTFCVNYSYYGLHVFDPILGWYEYPSHNEVIYIVSKRCVKWRVNYLESVHWYIVLKANSPISPCSIQHGFFQYVG